MLTRTNNGLTEEYTNNSDGATGYHGNGASRYHDNSDSPPKNDNQKQNGVDFQTSGESSSNGAQPIIFLPDNTPMTSEGDTSGITSPAMTSSAAVITGTSPGITSPGITSPTRTKRETKPSLSKIDFGEFYPEGGWGWVICTAVAIVYVLCNGFHYSYGSLYLVMIEHFPNNDSNAEWLGSLGLSTNMILSPVVSTVCGQGQVWLGSLGLSTNMLLSPVVSTVCRRKSPRLYAVIGGLIAALGCLFLAFSTKMVQLFISYGVVFSIGSGITCHTASIMIGRYFKQRRDVAELFVIASTGVGIAFMSVLFNKLNLYIRWTRMLQCISGVFILTIISGLLYRSVTLFHPRRKVILHIKNQQKSRVERNATKPRYFDFSALRMRSVQCLMFISAVVSVGLYVPILLLMRSAADDEPNTDALLLLNIYLGLGFALGATGHAYIIVKNNQKCVISRRYLCQSAALCCGVISLMVTMARDYNAFAIFAWLYGCCAGGYHFSLKSYTYELVRSRMMERAWGFITASQCLSILVGTPIAAYLNGASVSRPGYLFAGVFPLVGSMLFFTMSKAEKHPSNSEIIEKQESNAEYTVIETAALMDVNLSDFVTNKPLANQLLLSSGEHKRGGSSDASVYQLQCIITPKDTKHLTKIAEDSESGSEMPRVAGMSAGSDYLMTRTSCGSAMERDSSNGMSGDHSHDLFTSSSSSGNDRKGHGGRKGERIVKVELVDPPSQEKESTATVSYDSDLYINLCEALV